MCSSDLEFADRGSSKVERVPSGFGGAGVSDIGSITGGYFCFVGVYGEWEYAVSILEI